jgi:sporulation protein YlmC with PRC-barrel domain
MSSPNARQRLADFHLGASVFSSEGRHVGSLQRMIVDQDTWDPHHLVVKESVRFCGHLLTSAAGVMTDELIVPLHAVDQVTRERVDLSLTSKDVRRLHPYLTYQLAPVTASDSVMEILSTTFGAMRIPKEVEEAHKSQGDIEIRSGENVMLGHEGNKLGRVRDVLFDEGELVGIVVHPEGLLKHNVVIQTRFLERSDDGALFVLLQPEDLKHLQGFQ